MSEITHTSELQREIDRLSPHGREVWEAFKVSYKAMDSATELLALEVCRLVDRLDRLDRAAKSNKTWITIAEQIETPGVTKIVVQVDAVLAEVRQQGQALNQLLHKLGVGKLESGVSKTSEFASTLEAIRGL